jgi:hypothetical protein
MTVGPKFIVCINSSILSTHEGFQSAQEEAERVAGRDAKNHPEQAVANVQVYRLVGVIQATLPPPVTEFHAAVHEELNTAPLVGFGDTGDDMGPAGG